MKEIPVTNAGKFTADYMRQIYEYVWKAEKNNTQGLAGFAIVFIFTDLIACVGFFISYFRGETSDSPLIGILLFALLCVLCGVVYNIFKNIRRFKRTAKDDIKEYRLKRILLYPDDYKCKVYEGSGKFPIKKTSNLI